jgi:glycosyltransferase involved in cell wall biosynthesis
VNDTAKIETVPPTNRFPRRDGMPIAYLTTQYPAVSHSFIRREIHGIEKLGQPVVRYSVRQMPNDLPDPADQEEAARTNVILNGNWSRIIGSAVSTALARPAAFLKGLSCAVDMARKSGGEWTRHAAYLLEACWLRGEFRSADVRHVHVHFGTNPTAVARICHRMGGPTYSFTVHGPDEFDRPMPLDLRGKIADAAFCIAISSYGRSQLMRWSRFEDWPKIKVVRCGVDEQFTAPLANHPIPEAPNLCCIARLSAQKGLPLLVEAAAKLAARDRQFRLTLVGDGEMRAEIEAQIARHGLQDKVVLLGWASADTVREVLQASRAMVLPSFAEGLPVVIMEALALERPVITTAIAGIPELVDRNCGWVVPAGDIDALVEAMDSAISATTASLDVMGKTGRDRVLTMHQADRNAAQLLDILRESNFRS